MKTVLLAAIVAVWAAAASAHSPLETSTPADGAVIDAAPDQIILNFKGDIRLTRVTLTYADAEAVDLDLTGHNGFISDYVIAVEGRGAGLYQVTWRGLGDDGHAMTGSFDFTVE